MKNKLNMIDINKKYRTRRGGEVKGLFEFRGQLHGVEVVNDKLNFQVWKLDGRYSEPIHALSDLDLIEINEQEELLEEARRMYPVGTKFIDPDTGEIRTVADHCGTPFSYYSDQCITTSTPKSEWLKGGSNPKIYKNGQWAEIVKEHTVEVILYQTPTGSILAGEKVFVCAFDKMIAKKKITFYEGEGL